MKWLKYLPTIIATHGKVVNSVVTVVCCLSTALSYKQYQIDPYMHLSSLMLHIHAATLFIFCLNMCALCFV